MPVLACGGDAGRLWSGRAVPAGGVDGLAGLASTSWSRSHTAAGGTAWSFGGSRHEWLLLGQCGRTLRSHPIAKQWPDTPKGTGAPAERFMTKAEDRTNLSRTSIPVDLKTQAA